LLVSVVSVVVLTSCSFSWVILILGAGRIRIQSESLGRIIRFTNSRSDRTASDQLGANFIKLGSRCAGIYIGLYSADLTPRSYLLGLVYTHSIGVTEGSELWTALQCADTLLETAQSDWLPSTESSVLSFSAGRTQH